VAGGVIQVVELLPSKHEALSSNPSTERERERKINVFVFFFFVVLEFELRAS
jgi:hypothetical protein